jgi:hypothetical protein
MSYHTPTKPDQKFLDALLTRYTYDRESGQIRNIRLNKVSLGVYTSNGYRRLQVSVNYKRKKLRMHHVIWFFEYGQWPKSQLDHIDGNKVNNHYSNLRECSARENAQFYKAKKGTKGTSVFMGVSLCKSRGKWKAQISLDSPFSKPTYKNLGRFNCEIEAARAYDKALVKMGLAPFNITHYKDLMNKKETE